MCDESGTNAECGVRQSDEEDANTIQSIWGKGTTKSKGN